ncbi:hypothetical protein [Listeria booriae]|uniref:hypothetical protein n=1 Tax=Listeria booriae TaxID=1552123 RepID=UPI0016269F34|nr:hypothetical protein [Listeria booriae]MBC1359475.1 hypothetical protein [Listeria booriae]
MRKVVKYILVLIFSVLYLIASSFGESWLPKFDDLWTIISVLGFLCLYFYNESLLIFSWVNKTKNYFRKPQITWNLCYAVQTSAENSFDDTNLELLEYLKGKAGESQVRIIGKNETDCEYHIKTPDIRIYKLTQMDLDDDRIQMIIEYECTLIYKDSKTEIEEGLEFFKKLTERISIENKCELDEHMPLFQKPTFTLRLAFAELNPFYGMLVKRIDDKNIDTFEMQFKRGEALLKIKNSSMEIITDSEKYLKSVVRDYIVLANIK